LEHFSGELEVGLLWSIKTVVSHLKGVIRTSEKSGGLGRGYIFFWLNLQKLKLECWQIFLWRYTLRNFVVVTSLDKCLECAHFFLDGFKKAFLLINETYFGWSCRFLNTVFKNSHCCFFFFFLKNLAGENCSWKAWLRTVRRLLKLIIKRNLTVRFRCMLFPITLTVFLYLYRFIARWDVVVEIARGWGKVIHKTLQEFAHGMARSCSHMAWHEFTHPN